MSKMEAAANLFGGDDQGDDPFASFSEEPPTQTTPSTASEYTSSTELNSQPTVQPTSSTIPPNSATYEPPSNSSYAVPPSQSSPPAASPYAPPAQRYAPSNYVPQTYAPQTYDYAPQSYAQPAYSEPQYSPYSGGAAYNQPPPRPPVVPPSIVPPPAVPATPLERPKLTNAYDPPFPTNRARKPSARPPPQAAFHAHPPQPISQSLSPPPPPPPRQYSQPPLSTPIGPPPPSQYKTAPPPPPRRDSSASQASSGQVTSTHLSPPAASPVSSPDSLKGPNVPAYGPYKASVPRTSSPLAYVSSYDHSSSSEVAPHASLEGNPRDSPPTERNGSPALRYALQHRTPSNGLDAHPSINGPSASSDPYAPQVAKSSFSPPQDSVHQLSADNANSLYQPPAVPPTEPDAESTSPQSTFTSGGGGPYHPSAYDPPKPSLPPTTSQTAYPPASGPAFPEYPGIVHRQETSDFSDQGSYTSRYNYNPGSSLESAEPTNPPPPVQELTVPTTLTPYAPSPSLLGTNDPLQRSLKRVPVFTFGFGGKVVSCFHGADAFSTGFDVALASRKSTAVAIQNINKLIPEVAQEIASSSFPGPLFGDNNSNTITAVMGSTQNKNKKTKVVGYLNQRIDELTTSANSIPVSSPTRKVLDGKLVLLKLLRLLVENDGRIAPAAEKAVRSALLPDLEHEEASSAVTFTPAASFASLHASDSSGDIIATSQVKRSSLDKIQSFLLRGDRRAAYHYALDEKLWPHAMIIASNLDREAWKEVVGEFLKAELSANVVDKSASLSATHDLKPNGLESLKVAYSLYSGQGSAAVQQLAPPNILARPGARAPVATASHLTPMTPNFFAPTASSQIPEESLAKWATTLAMMYSNTITPETSAAITALGDQLLANGLVEPAHCCYLLAPQTSGISGIGNPSARIVLVGLPSPQVSPSFTKDPDYVILSEILEFAYSLHSPAKGQEPFRGFPHLQAYRFIRATALAEMGEVQLSTKYCDAITASLNQPSAYFTVPLMQQLNELANHNAGIAATEKPGSWKISKPSLDGFGGWLDRGITKLVTGGDSDVSPPNRANPDPQGFAGPFAHYSAISSTTSSASVSPRASVTSLNQFPSSEHQPPNGTGHYKYPPPIDRASSAFDYNRKKSSPVYRTASANALTTTFAQSTGYRPSDRFAQSSFNDAEEDEDAEGGGGQEVTWWGSSSYAGKNDGGNGVESSMATPTVVSFNKVTSNGHSSTAQDGLLSLMDNSPMSFGPVATTTSTTSRDINLNDDVDDEEDLGFGNKKKKVEAVNDADNVTGQPQAASSGTTTTTAGAEDEKDTPSAAGQQQPAQPAQNGGGWFSRLWGGGSGSKPAPIKANLGEQSSFYYDKELKKWVNKKAGDSTTPSTPAPPPPPSRSQTASPGMSGAGRHTQVPPMSTGTPPPPRATSVAAGSSESGALPPPPPRPVSRIKSSLSMPPLDGDSGTMPAAPGTPTGSRLAIPTPPPPLGGGMAMDGGPPSRPRSSASKKPRYAKLA